VDINTWLQGFPKIWRSVRITWRSVCFRPKRSDKITLCRFLKTKYIQIRLVMWTLTLCSSDKFRRFRGTYHLHFYGRRIRQERNHQKQSWFLAWLTILKWTWKRYVPPKRCALSKLHASTQKITIHSHCRQKNSKINSRSERALTIVLWHDA
jgi:hypothetical protein